MRTTYRAARVFDGHELHTAPGGMAVVVSGDRIDTVVAAAAIGADHPRVDLGDVTILPGLIDVHVHLAWDGSAGALDRVDREPRDRTVLRAVNHAAAHLRAGVTTVRDLGSPGGLAIEVARAIDDGVVPGPRVLAAGRAIAMTGGHGHTIAREADGVDAVRRAVRGELKAGARCIKIMASAGVLDGDGDEVGAPQLSQPELRAAVEEAHRAGRPVAAHAHSLESIRDALTAGVRSVEHGTGLDAATARRMSRDQVCLVPTLSAVDAVQRLAGAGLLPYDVTTRIAKVADHNGAAFHTALRHDVRFAAGSDAGVPGQPHGALPDELAAMVRAGASPLQALRAATSTAAALLGLTDHGTLEPGTHADLLVVGGDPLTDIGALHDVRLVIRDGAVVHGPTHGRPVDLAVRVRDFVRAYHDVARGFARRTDLLGYRRSHQRILLELGARPSIEIADLRAALDIDAGQLSHATHELDARGDIEFHDCPTDRRRRTITITESGLRAYEQLNAATDMAIEEFLGGFTDAEQTRLAIAMDTVRHLLDASS